MKKTNKDDRISKKMTVEMGGQELTLNIGVNYFFKYYKDATGIDLLKDGLVEVMSVRVFEYAKGIVWGGYAAECSVNKVEIVYTPEDVEHWVMSMNQDDVNDLVMRFSACRQGITVKELEKKISEEIKNVLTQD